MKKSNLKSNSKSLLIIMLILIMLVSLLVLSSCNKDPDDNGIIIPPDEDPYLPDKTVTTTKLVTYEGPNLMESSSKLSVSVEDQDLFVYETRVNHNRIFSFSAPSTMAQVVIFDFEGRVTLEIVVNDATTITDVVVRPLAYEIEPQINGNKATITLDYSGNYSFEYKKDGAGVATENALHIFANEIEANPIDAENIPDDVIYIGPGVYEAGAIPVESNKTVYLAGGAYVYGQIRAELVDNLTIRGRGIISGSIYTRARASEYVLPIEIRSSTNIIIEGITILDPAGWAVTLYKCDGATIDNLKIITARANGDGVSLQSSKNVTMNGGFVRTWDDSLVVKNVDRGITDKVLFDNVVLWTDLAQSCEVGYETNGASMQDITFRNITILHNFHKAALSIHNADDADISNVNFINITLENGQMLGDNQFDGINDFFIDITIAHSPEWSKSGGIRGSVKDVLFSNIKVLKLAETVTSRMLGESMQSNIQGVIFNNIEIEGTLITDASALGLASNPFVSGISFANEGTLNGARIKLPYILDLANEAVDKIHILTRIQEGLEVPEFSILDIQESYMGVKIDTSSVEVSATHGVGQTLAAIYDDGSGSWETPAGPLSNLLDGDRSTAWIPQNWTGEADEFIALTFDFGMAVRPGTIRVYLSEESNYVYNYNISVFIKREATTANFSRSLPNSFFSATPAKGNYFDIKLSSTLECYQLQLRIFRTTGMTAPQQLSLNQIVFYPASLATNKPIIASTEHNDVYTSNYLTDGNDSTYWEAVSDDAYFVVDLQQTYTISHINLHLPPLLTWEPRTQTIEVLYSVDNINFTVLFVQTDYLFDPMTGNVIELVIDVPVQARYVKLQWSSNVSLGNYGAQLSEIYVYGQ